MFTRHRCSEKNRLTPNKCLYLFDEYTYVLFGVCFLLPRTSKFGTTYLRTKKTHLILPDMLYPTRELLVAGATTTTPTVVRHTSSRVSCFSVGGCPCQYHLIYLQHIYIILAIRPEHLVCGPVSGKLFQLRGTIVNRTYGTHKKLYV